MTLLLLLKGRFMALALRILSQDSSSITLGWDPPEGAAGYRFTSEKQAGVYSNSNDPARNSVRFAKGSAWYKVQAFGIISEGEYRP